ncbi:MAG: MMPL family transporter [bacterium]
MVQLPERTSTTMRSYIRFVINFRVSIILLMVLVTALAGYSISQAELSSSILDMFFGNNPRFQLYQQRVRQFAHDRVIMVGVEEPEPLSPAGIGRLKKLKSNLEEISMVRRVHSLLDLYLLDREKEALFPRRYSEVALATPDRVPELVSRLLQDPMAGGVLVSRDGKHSLVVIEVAPLPGQTRDTEKPHRLMKIITEAFKDAGYSEDRIHKAGLIPLVAEMIRQTHYSFRVLLPVIAGVLFLTMLAAYRRAWPVLIAAAVSIPVMVWTLGFGIYLFHRVSILMAIAPAVVMIVSFSDVIHLCSSYYQELSAGGSKSRAILNSGAEVGRACVYTSCTALAGFISLIIVPAPAFQEMGIVLGFGAVAALLLALTLSPIIFYYLKAPVSAEEKTAQAEKSQPDRTLGVFLRAGTGRPLLVIAVFAAVAIAASLGTSMIEFETGLAERFSEDSETGRDDRYFDRHFSGTNYMEVYVDTHEKNGLTDPEQFSRISALEEKLESLPEVDLAWSVFDYVDALYPVFHPDLYKDHPAPPNKDIIYQYLLLLEGTMGPVERLVDGNFQTVRIFLRLPDGGLIKTRETATKAARLARNTLQGKARLEVSGLSVLLGVCLDNLIAGQREGLFFAFFIILIMMTVALHSWRSGMVSMLPNLFPLLVLGGYLGFFQDRTDPDVLAVAIIATGIAADGTIRFLLRYSNEREKDLDVDQALANTFHYSGRAIVITTVVLAAGFIPFNLSDYSTTRLHGTLLPVCLLISLAADLVLLPALIKIKAISLKP